MRLSELCKTITTNGFPAVLHGADAEVTSVSTLEDAGDGDVSFLSNEKYARLLPATRATAVIVKPGLVAPDGLTTIRCDDPYAAVTVAIIVLHGHRRHPRWGRDPRAAIDPTAVIGENAHIAAGATVCADARLGANVTLYPGSFVGPRARLGDDVVLYPNVVIYDDCVLGDRVVIHAGTVIGEDGLGYAPVGDKWLKIPQVGRVVIEADVEIGALCTIDRATLGQTVIGSGTKFSNLIAIGHGSRVGADCMLVAQVGVAGSVTIGRHVTIAGQVGFAGHQTIGDNARIGAQSGVAGDVPSGAEVLGAPAVPISDARRQYAAIKKLPKWSREVGARIAELERELAVLKRRLEAQ